MATADSHHLEHIRAALRQNLEDELAAYDCRAARRAQLERVEARLLQHLERAPAPEAGGSDERSHRALLASQLRAAVGDLRLALFDA